MTTAFRAEPSKGPLHLAEFLMVEWELVTKKLDKNMKVAEELCKRCIGEILKECSYELDYLEEYRVASIVAEEREQLKIHDGLRKSLGKKEWSLEKTKITDRYFVLKSSPSLKERLTRYVENSFIRTTHHDCVAMMLEHVEKGFVQFSEVPTFDGDLSKEHERYITEVLFDNMPTFVRYFPKKIKSFYMPEIEGSDIERVDCYDLLFPQIGEVVGGSQRIHDYTQLKQRMSEEMSEASAKELDWYLDLRKYGTVPHGGAGLGFGRLLMAITGIFNIKDMQEFPRGYGLSCFA